MTLSDLNFIFRGLPLFLIIYYVFPAKLRPCLLLLGSILFYALNDFMMLGVLCATTIFNFLMALAVNKKNKLAFVSAIVVNAGLLIGFKVAGHLNSGILLPLGLSFYVFKMISYQADLYNGKIEKVDFIKLANYFTMFPQIISGPISRYDFVTENKFWRPTEDGISKKEHILSVQDCL